MKKTICLVLTLFLLIASIVLLILSVDFNKDESDNHEHTYKMRFDDYYHWNEAVCHTDIKTENQSHNYNSEFVCEICGYQMRNLVEPSLIVQSVSPNINQVKITWIDDEDIAEITIDDNVIKIKVEDDERYYHFLGNGYAELYTFDDSWHKTTYENEDCYLERFFEINLPGFTLLSTISDKSFNVMQFDALAKTTPFEYIGNWETNIKEYIGVVHYDDDYLVSKIEATYIYNTIEYKFVVEYDVEKLVCPYVPSEGISFEPNVDGTYVIKDMGDCTDIHIVIPSEINGIPVTSIAPEAFKNNTYIQSVIIPGSVKLIGESAFEGCNSLQNIILQDGVQEIGDKSFYLSNPRAYLEFTDSVTKIGFDAFAADVAYFDKGTWNFIGDINKYVEIDFENNYSNPGQSRFMFLNGEELKNVKIDTATHINSFAFLNADNMENYYIGKQVTYFGEQSITSFRQYKDENQIVHCIPHNLYYDGTLEEFMNIEKNGLWTLGDWNLYCKNTLIDTIVIENMESVPLGMFHQCVGLKHLIIKDGVKSVGRYAFYGIDFETVELPESLTEFEYWAFLHASIPDNTGIFTMVEYYEGETYHVAIYMRVGNNPYYLLVERSYTNVKIHENTKYQQQQQWECPEWEDWYEEPSPTT